MARTRTRTARPKREVAVSMPAARTKHRAAAHESIPANPVSYQVSAGGRRNPLRAQIQPAPAPARPAKVARTQSTPQEVVPVEFLEDEMQEVERIEGQPDDADVAAEADPGSDVSFTEASNHQPEPLEVRSVGARRPVVGRNPLRSRSL